MSNGNSGGKSRDRRTTEGKDKKGGRTVETAAPALLRLWGLLLLSGASRLRGRLPFHPISEVGAFISVKENQ